MKPSYSWGSPREQLLQTHNNFTSFLLLPEGRNFSLRGNTYFTSDVGLALLANPTSFHVLPIHTLWARPEHDESGAAKPKMLKPASFLLLSSKHNLLIFSNEVKVNQAWNAIKHHSSTYWNLQCLVYFVTTFTWCVWSLIILMKIMLHPYVKWALDYATEEQVYF